MISAQLTFESIKNAFGAQSIKPSQTFAPQTGQPARVAAAANVKIAVPPRRALFTSQTLTVPGMQSNEKSLGDTPPRWQIIYRVRRQQQWSNTAVTQNMREWDHWLDNPRWCHEPKLRRYDEPVMDARAVAPVSLRGSIPVSDIGTYLYQHRELLFLVIRDYEPKHHQGTSRGRFLPSRDDVPNGEKEGPPPSSELISIVSTDLYKTCDKMFTSLPYRPSGFRPKHNYQLDAPYLSVYHSRSSLRDRASRLSLREQENWKLLVNYILETFGSEYEQVDTLISRGRISKSFIPYLFRPKQYLVRNENGVVRGYMSDSWLKISQRIPVTDEDSTFGDNSSSVGSGDLPVEDGGSSPEDERSFAGGEESCPGYFPADYEDETSSTYEVAAWAVKAHCWDFDGTFYVRSEEFQIPWTWRREEVVPISDLSLYPLDSAEDSVHSLLETRGRIFWSCRKQRHVSYKGQRDYEVGFLPIMV